MRKEKKLSNANLEEIRKLKLEKYKLWFNVTSNIYKGFASVLFTALIFVVVFYLNKFENFDWSSSLDTLLILFLFVSMVYFVICNTLISFVNVLILEIKIKNVYNKKHKN